MNTVRKVYESDSTGTVHLDVGVGAPHRKVEVVVSWDESSPEEGPLDGGWPVGWFEANFGCIDDPTFARPAQGDFEAREDF